MKLSRPGVDPLTTLYHARKTITFTAAAGAGAVETSTLFTITGRVLLERLTAFCTSDLTSGGAATISMGVSGAAVDTFIASTAFSDIDANEWWSDATPASGAEEQILSNLFDRMTSFTLSGNITFTVGTTTITGGVIIFDAWYYPITDTGMLS